MGENRGGSRADSPILLGGQGRSPEYIVRERSITRDLVLIAAGALASLVGLWCGGAL